MLVLIGDKEYVDLDKCKYLDTGQDGTLYLYGDTAIKICHSKCMTYGKFDDFQTVIKRVSDNGEDISKKHIILPTEIVDDPENKIKHLAINPLFGYTQSYKVENHNGIGALKTNEFILYIEMIHREIHELFTENMIGINDNNPKNILVSETGEMFFIDHDKNFTPSSRNQKNEIENFFMHNETKFTEIVNRALVLQTFRGVYMTNANLRRVLDVMHEEQLRMPTIGAIYDTIGKYDTISKYTNAKRVLELEFKKIS